MANGGKARVLRALLLAIGQLDDRAWFGVLGRSVLLTLLAYALLLAGSYEAVQALLASRHWVAWVATLLATAGVAVLAVWLFLPTVLVISTLFIERIAATVERRHYPWLPPPSPAALHAQLWDGAALALRVLLLNGVALLLALLIPGVGLLLALLISGWAIGRGLFVAVAMRRMGRLEAQAVYRGERWAVLVPGLLLAVAATIPGINLLVPIIGTAAMVHVLNRSHYAQSYVN